jgi:hypothetical protein
LRRHAPLGHPLRRRARSFVSFKRTQRVESACRKIALHPSQQDKESVMAIIATFEVDDIDASAGSSRIVNLSAAPAGQGDNTSWSTDHFPAGELAMTITEPTMLNFFQPGKKYRVTIQPL